MTSMNANNNFFKKLPPQAPLVSQISDNDEGEEDELERVIRQQRYHLPEVNELQQLQSYLMQRNTTFFATTTYEDERFSVDQDLVEKIEAQIGYPRTLITQSVEQLEMNDAATCYYLLDKVKQQGAAVVMAVTMNTRTEYSPQNFNPVSQKQQQVYDEQEHKQLLLFNRSPSQANLLNFEEPQTVKQMVKP